MKPFLIYLGALGIVATIVVTATALWYARSALPFIGTLLIISIGILVVGFTVWLLGYGYLHLRSMALKQRLMVADDHRLAWHDQGRVMVIPTRTVTAIPPPPPLPIEEDRLMLPQAPRYSEIAHLVCPGRLILGYNVSGPIVGDVTDLLSTCIIGRPGTGKSTWLRCVLAQVLRIGGQACIWDPHGSIADELGDMLAVNESVNDITASAAWVEAELDRRLAARRAGTSNHTPMLLIVDELPVVNAMCPDAINAIRRVVLEARKVGMFGLISGQGVPASLLGGSLVRDALSSRYVFHTTAQQARLAGLDNDTAKVLLAQLETSGPGLAVLATARRRPEIVAIPQTVVDDIASRSTSTYESDRKQLDTAFPVFPEIDTGDVEAVKLPVSESEKQQIIALARAGVARRDIPKALRWSASKYGIIKSVLDEAGL